MSEEVCVIFRITRKASKSSWEQYIKLYEIEPMMELPEDEKQEEEVKLPKPRRSLL